MTKEAEGQGEEALNWNFWHATDKMVDGNWYTSCPSWQTGWYKTRSKVKAIRCHKAAKPQRLQQALRKNAESSNMPWFLTRYSYAVGVFGTVVVRPSVVYLSRMYCG